MRVAVVGSRTFNDYDLLRRELDKMYPNISLIVSGGAKGADSLAEKYAKEEGISTLVFRPDWNQFGKRAGFIRNKDIVTNSDTVVAFWDGKSKGTANSIKHAQFMGKKLIIVKFNEVSTTNKG